MNELINIATVIGYVYLAFSALVFIVSIVVMVFIYKFFKQHFADMAEMEQRHKEMRERFEGKRKHQIKL